LVVDESSFLTFSASYPWADEVVDSFKARKGLEIEYDLSTVDK
jgi:hypothetical protein